MKVLLDTHAFLWWLREDARLSKRAAGIIRDSENQVLISAVVGWEIAIKVGSGKIAPATIIQGLQDAVFAEAFVELPITLAHGVRAGALPLHHRDPFDRLLVAQAQAEGIPIVSNDRALTGYGVRLIW